MTSEIDMELLRRIGTIRSAAEASDEGSVDPKRLAEALADARHRVEPGLTLLRRAFDVLESAARTGHDPDSTGRLALVVAEAAEGYLVQLGEPEAHARFRDEVDPVLEELGAEWEEDESTPDGDGTEMESPPSTPTDAGTGHGTLLDRIGMALVRARDDAAGLEEVAELLGEVVRRTGTLTEALTLARSGLDGEGEVEAVLDGIGLQVEEAILEAEMSGAEASPDGPGEARPPHRSDGGEADHGPPALDQDGDGSAPEAPPTSREPAELLPAGADTDLVRDFVDEGFEHLAQAEEALLRLEASPDDTEAVNVVFRAFHTIKGVAGFLELHFVSELAHHAESLLSHVRDGTLPFTSTVADLTLRSADGLRGLLDAIQDALAGGDARSPAGLVDLVAVLDDDTLLERLAAGEAFDLPSPSALAGDEEGGEAGNQGADDGARSDVSVPGSAQEASVRVKTDRLDRLVDLVGELVVAHSMVAQDPKIQSRHADLSRKVDRAGKILRDLQDLSTSLRMVPLRGSFRKVSRVVRDLSRRSGKPVELVTEGEGTELDRGMVNVMTDPLVHMVRNAMDHGLESPEERRAVGKPPKGRITLSACQSGGSVVIEIADDGRGIDREAVLAKARDRGIVDPDRTLSDEEVNALIFAPGFSTSASVTEISGRGVGMDVVRRGIESLRGRVEVFSEPGSGTRFVMHLPLTLAITEGMLLRVGPERYIVPMVKIQESFRPRPEDVSTVSGRGEMVRLHGRLVPIVRLHEVYDVEGARTDPLESLLMVVGTGSRRSALLVDELLGQQHFVVKPMADSIARTPGVAGGAILGDGSVGLILDPDEIVAVARNGKAVA